MAGNSKSWPQRTTRDVEVEERRGLTIAVFALTLCVKYVADVCLRQESKKEIAALHLAARTICRYSHFAWVTTREIEKPRHPRRRVCTLFPQRTSLQKHVADLAVAGWKRADGYRFNNRRQWGKGFRVCLGSEPV